MFYSNCGFRTMWLINTIIEESQLFLECFLWIKPIIFATKFPLHAFFLCINRFKYSSHILSRTKTRMRVIFNRHFYLVRRKSKSGHGTHGVHEVKISELNSCGVRTNTSNHLFEWCINHFNVLIWLARI